MIKNNIISYLKYKLSQENEIISSCKIRNIQLDVSIFQKIKDFLNKENISISECDFLPEVLLLPNVLSLDVKEENQIFFEQNIKKENIYTEYLNPEKNIEFYIEQKISPVRKLQFLQPVSLLVQELLSQAKQHALKNNFVFTNVSEIASEAETKRTGHYNFFEHEMFSLIKDSKKIFLIPTSEVTLFNYLMDKKITGDVCAVTKCFRKEGGTFGLQQKYIRQNEFLKFELLTISSGEESINKFNKIFNTVKEFIETLGLKFRIIINASDNMSKLAAKTIDFEIWSPSKKTFVEVSSVSNMFTSQTERCILPFATDSFHLDISKTMKIKNLWHSANGSLLALERIVFLILDNYFYYND